jgi:hypothetical protein
MSYLLDISQYCTRLEMHENTIIREKTNLVSVPKNIHCKPICSQKGAFLGHFTYSMPALGSSAPSFALAHFVYPCPAFELG